MADYQAVGVPDVEAALKVAFTTPPFYEFYSNIHRKYKDFEFTDTLSDEERLLEYSNVYQQFRKFVGSKQAVVLGMQDHLDSLVAYVDDQRAKADTYPRTRVDMVYNSLKVDWLIQLRNMATNIIEEIRGGGY